MECHVFELGALAVKQHEAYFLLQYNKVAKLLDQSKDIVVALPTGVTASKYEILVDQGTVRLLTQKGKSLWIRHRALQLQIYPGALLTRTFLRKLTAGEPVKILIEVGPSTEYKQRLEELLAGEAFQDYELVSDLYWLSIGGETATTGFDLESLPMSVYVSFTVSRGDLGEAEPEYLGLYQFGNSLKYLGGIEKSKSPLRIETELRELNGFYALLALEKNFTDINQHPARNIIMQLASRHIFNGISDHLFGPDLPMTRAEIAVVIYRGIGVSTYVPNVSPFTDVSVKDWYYREVASVDKVGIMQGAEGKFLPYRPITRQELALVITRALDYKGDSPLLSEEQALATLKELGDVDQIAKWARKAVAIAIKEGLMEVVGRKFQPNEQVSRGEVVVLIHKIMLRLNLI